MAAATLSPPLLPATSRIANKTLTAPEGMAVNGHFASAGQNGSANFEHGVQIIDENKEFKYGHHPQDLRRAKFG
jgi:hypothetical protein